MFRWYLKLCETKYCGVNYSKIGGNTVSACVLTRRVCPSEQSASFDYIKRDKYYILIVIDSNNKYNGMGHSLKDFQCSKVTEPPQ